MVQDDPWIDTMQLIKEDPFKETMRRGNGYGMKKKQSCFLLWTVIPSLMMMWMIQRECLALNVDSIFEADECVCISSVVDEGPMTQTMFMASLTSEDPIYDEAGPSYDSNNPLEVIDHDAFVDHMDEYHDVHEMQNDVTNTTTLLTLMLTIR
ncbi:hypothetical protein Tco_1102136 [Tanacetum coccineum]